MKSHSFLFWLKVALTARLPVSPGIPARDSGHNHVLISNPSLHPISRSCARHSCRELLTDLQQKLNYFFQSSSQGSHHESVQNTSGHSHGVNLLDFLPIPKSGSSCQRGDHTRVGLPVHPSSADFMESKQSRQRLRIISFLPPPSQPLSITLN